MRFSPTAVVALVGSLLSHPPVDAAAKHHPGARFRKRCALLPRGYVNRVFEKHRAGAASNIDGYMQMSVHEHATTLAQSQKPLRKSHPRPLWELEAKEETVEVDMKQDAAVDLGILANTKTYDRYRALIIEEAVSCVGINATPEFDCDCSGFDEATNTGTFACTAAEGYYGDYNVSYSYEITDDPGTYSIAVTYLFSQEEGLSHSYEVFYEDGVITACAAAINGCECICSLGVCPDDVSEETTVVNVQCPGIEVLDACSQGDGGTEDEITALLASAEKCPADSPPPTDGSPPPRPEDGSPPPGDGSPPPRPEDGSPPPGDGSSPPADGSPPPRPEDGSPAPADGSPPPRPEDASPSPETGDVVGTETSTVVPSMGETVSETIGETMVMTTMTTDESAALQRGGGRL